ncbi:MAG TPA: PD-(D/E)XK nuclease family protein, partial [Patescibacteria group bacterium]|nr:PD-(D/E)XK nuclease family protein [Patescibacteria group bacterium]
MRAFYYVIINETEQLLAAQSELHPEGVSSLSIFMAQSYSSYNPNRSSAWNYGGRNWKLSRSKIELFTNCARCFYIDNKLGTKRPSMPSFLINTAVDHQLKNEFDAYRKAGKAHPFQEEFKIDAIPAPHEKLDTWRENFEGVIYHHPETGMTISGAIDDLWINPKTGEYIVVDYKATAKEEPKTELNDGWDNAYRKQMEIYQWLLRKNNLKVSNTGYFVYCTGRHDQQTFDKVIEFDVVLIPYTGDDSWVEGTIREIKKCLDS